MVTRSVSLTSVGRRQVEERDTEMQRALDVIALVERLLRSPGRRIRQRIHGRRCGCQITHHDTGAARKAHHRFYGCASELRAEARARNLNVAGVFNCDRLTDRELPDGEADLRIDPLLCKQIQHRRFPTRSRPGDDGAGACTPRAWLDLRQRQKTQPAIRNLAANLLESRTIEADERKLRVMMLDPARGKSERVARRAIDRPLDLAAFRAGLATRRDGPVVTDIERAVRELDLNALLEGDWFTIGDRDTLG
jgi:hypothetical protein